MYHQAYADQQVFAEETILMDAPGQGLLPLVTQPLISAQTAVPHPEPAVHLPTIQPAVTVQKPKPVPM